MRPWNGLTCAEEGTGSALEGPQHELGSCSDEETEDADDELDDESEEEEDEASELCAGAVEEGLAPDSSGMGLSLPAAARHLSNADANAKSPGKREEWNARARAIEGEATE